MKIIKFVAGLFLSLISMSTTAQEAQPFTTKIYGNVTSTQEKLITNAFLYLNKFWADKGKSLSRQVLFILSNLGCTN